MSLRRRLKWTTPRARLTARPDGPLLITSAANAESQPYSLVFFLVFVFVFFLNRRNNRRRPAADNSGGVIRRFPFRSRSLVSVCTFRINYHHTCWRKQTRFVILISLLFFFFHHFPQPVGRLLLFFPNEFTVRRYRAHMRVYIVFGRTRHWRRPRLSSRVVLNDYVGRRNN